MRTSTPRSRSTRSAVRDSRGCSSGSTRGAVSSSIQRIRWSRKRGVGLGELGGEPGALRGHLGAGVARPDHDERAPGRAVGGLGRGQLDLAHQVVAQVERLGDAAVAVRVVADAGDRQQPVDAAHGEHQPVVGGLAVVAVGVGPVHDAAVDVDPVDRRHHQLRPRQRPRQRHRDVPRLDDAGGHLGQQRQVEEVVLGVDDGDLGGVAESAQQPAGRGEPRETRSDDDDARPHRRHGSGQSHGAHRTLRAARAGMLPP